MAERMAPLTLTDAAVERVKALLDSRANPRRASVSACAARVALV